MSNNQHTTAPNLATLIDATGDPIDAMKFAADLFAMSAFRAERAVAIEAGLAVPLPPEPLSNYLRAFTVDLKVKLSAVAGLFGVDEIERLKSIGPAIARGLERNDEQLAEEIYKLACMPPDDAASWVRGHLDYIEQRFAS